MIINLVPQYRDDTIVVSKQGDVLTINGQAFDLSVIPDGATLPAGAIDSEWFADKIERAAGVLTVYLYVPDTSDSSHAARYPEPIINPANGVLELPQ